jgi:hypothetical protein
MSRITQTKGLPLSSRKPSPAAGTARAIVRRLARLGAAAEPPSVSGGPTDVFWATHYQRHNQRRLEHLASLALPISGASVLEVGAGIGDHTSFFLDRGCTVLSSEPREDNLALLRERYPEIRVERLDLDSPRDEIADVFDVVYCYGTLYHLHRPAEAIAYMSEHCSGMLLLETCVSKGDEEAINLVAEVQENQSQSIYGTGCRPTRPWVFNRLKEHFAHVYMPETQPWHEEFPLDWIRATEPDVLTRSVFIASRKPLVNDRLIEGIPLRQVHD